MQDFNTLLINRRSYRKYLNEPLSGDSVQLILEAALLSPTSKNKHSWEFVVVENKEMLTKLSACKPHGANFIADAALAVVVLGNPLESDVWIEDASIATINMQLQAEELGIGSCWVQVRNREFSETVSSGEYINDILEIPMPLEVLCIISFGKKEKPRSPNNMDNLLWEKIHIEKYKFSQD
ncbi:MAG: nitroreductase family protein [Bacteroidia bacterium]|nr:nitroreductase family protein [Bacteroidia bacterium]